MSIKCKWELLHRDTRKRIKLINKIFWLHYTCYYYYAYVNSYDTSIFRLHLYLDSNTTRSCYLKHYTKYLFFDGGVEFITFDNLGRQSVNERSYTQLIEYPICFIKNYSISEYLDYLAKVENILGYL